MNLDDILSAAEIAALRERATWSRHVAPTLAEVRAVLDSHEALRAAHAQTRAALVMLVDWVDLSAGAFELQYGTDDNDAAWAKARAALGGEG